eukprot:scaffold51_cov401-Prasinococcus_capsulatus_cf.AAC.11
MVGPMVGPTVESEHDHRKTVGILVRYHRFGSIRSVIPTDLFGPPTARGASSREGVLLGLLHAHVVHAYEVD